MPAVSDGGGRLTYLYPLGNAAWRAFGWAGAAAAVLWIATGWPATEHALVLAAIPVSAAAIALCAALRYRLTLDGDQLIRRTLLTTRRVDRALFAGWLRTPGAILFCPPEAHPERSSLVPVPLEIALDENLRQWLSPLHDWTADSAKWTALRNDEAIGKTPEQRVRRIAAAFRFHTLSLASGVVLSLAAMRSRWPLLQWTLLAFLLMDAMVSGWYRGCFRLKPAGRGVRLALGWNLWFPAFASVALCAGGGNIATAGWVAGVLVAAAITGLYARAAARPYRIVDFVMIVPLGMVFGICAAIHITTSTK